MKELRKEIVSRQTIHSFNKALLSTNHSLSPHYAEDMEVKNTVLAIQASLMLGRKTSEQMPCCMNKEEHRKLAPNPE